MFHFFPVVWKHALTDKIFKQNHQWFNNYQITDFKILIDKSSCSCALHGSRALITLMISIFSNLIEEILAFVIYV